MSTDQDREGESINSQPFQGQLTVIWDHEKALLHARLDAAEARLNVLEAWAQQVYPRR